MKVMLDAGNAPDPEPIGRPHEVGPNPGLLNAYWAAITQHLRVGQLGYVMIWSAS